MSLKPCGLSAQETHDGCAPAPHGSGVHRGGSSPGARQISSCRIRDWCISYDASQAPMSYGDQAIPCTGFYAGGSCAALSSDYRSKGRRQSVPSYGHRGLHTRHHTPCRTKQHATDGIFHSRLILSGLSLVRVQSLSYLCAL